MELLLFISGILFTLVLLPLLESVTSLAITWIESKKIKYSEAINDGNIRMQQAANHNEECSTRPIGFILSNEEGEEYEDEDF